VPHKRRRNGPGGEEQVADGGRQEHRA
jgi:hypothetical protein